MFYPHGLTVTSLKDGGVELLVVNHGGREAIEFFRVTLREAAPHADWIGCAPLPGHDFGNGVAPLPTGGFVVTNMYDTTDTDFLEKFAMAQPTGGVLQWTPQKGWSDAVSRRLSGANGVEVTPRWQVALRKRMGGSETLGVLPENKGRSPERRCGFPSG